MTVANLLRAREGAAFSGGLKRLLQARELTALGLARLAQPARPDGKTRGAAAVRDCVVDGRRPRDKTIGLWAAALEMPLEELLSLRGGELPGLAPPAARDKPAASLVTQDRPVASAVSLRAAEQFSLVIDQAGVATLRLNMVGVPMDLALRAMAALTAAGLLATTPRKEPDE